MKKIILASFFTLATLNIFAMAGFAERWLHGWVNDLFCALTVAAVQLILICCVFIARKRLKRTAIFELCTKISTNELASAAVGGLLLSFVISAYLWCICNAFFIYAIFPFLVFWILDWLVAFIPTWRNKITGAKAILYLGVMSIAIPIAYAFYNNVVQFEWLTNIYRYSYSDSSVPEFLFVIYPTMKISVANRFPDILILYFPWLLSALIKGVKIIIKNRRKD